MYISKTQACPQECHSMWIPWETSRGMGCDSTHLYFPWDSSHVIATSEIEWECQIDTELSYLDYASEF